MDTYWSENIAQKWTNDFREVQPTVHNPCLCGIHQFSICGGERVLDVQTVFKSMIVISPVLMFLRQWNELPSTNHQTQFSWTSRMTSFRVAGVWSFKAIPNRIGCKTPLAYTDIPICFAYTYVKGYKRNIEWRIIFVISSLCCTLWFLAAIFDGGNKFLQHVTKRCYFYVWNFSPME